MSQHEDQHPATVRIAHWINAIATIVMILSGWRIYDAAPLYDFTIPRDWTLGGWLAGAVQWHLAALWALLLNGAVYVAYAAASGRLLKRLRPPGARLLVSALQAALRGELPHVPGEYNALQRGAYLAAIAILALLVVSGFVVWKPVQLHAIGRWLGDYEGARLIHFYGMCALVAFLAGHVAMALAVPRTLRAMVWPRRAGGKAAA